jgi:hypothetical protein
VGNTATVRQAKLRPESAERYPTLPARMWTSATWLAELVASFRGAQSGTPDKDRILTEADFEFRGGIPRWWGGLFERTRTGELRYSG